VSDNVEVVRRGVEALGRWDVEALLPDCDPEIEFVSLVGQVEGHSYHGHEGIRQFVSDLSEAWDVWEPVPEHLEAADGKLWWSKIYSDPAEARTRYEALGANA
jgi:hypothetical protein